MRIPGKFALWTGLPEASRSNSFNDDVGAPCSSKLVRMISNIFPTSKSPPWRNTVLRVARLDLPISFNDDWYSTSVSPILAKACTSVPVKLIPFALRYWSRSLKFAAISALLCTENLALSFTPEVSTCKNLYWLSMSIADTLRLMYFAPLLIFSASVK